MVPSRELVRCEGVLDRTGLCSDSRCGLFILRDSHFVRKQKCKEGLEIQFQGGSEDA